MEKQHDSMGAILTNNQDHRACHMDGLGGFLGRRGTGGCVAFGGTGSEIMKNMTRWELCKRALLVAFIIVLFIHLILWAGILLNVMGCGR